MMSNQGALAIKIDLMILFAVLAIIISCRPSDSAISSIPPSDTYKIDTVHKALDEVVNETSGLMIIDSRLWTINDSGGLPIVYNIDMKTGEVIREVVVRDVENVDWEELTHDDQNFYIGNFGNNLGKRKDLVIYKGNISDLLVNDTVEVENIHISYSDQNKFYNGYDHNHDCEAMIVYRDSLYLFSKNWEDQRCKLYKLPAVPGSYELEVVSSFDSKGTITGSAISQDGRTIVLVGYVSIPRKGFDPFIWVLGGWQGDDFFSGERKRFDFSTRRQMEGVDFISQEEIIITAEDEVGRGPSMYSFKL